MYGVGPGVCAEYRLRVDLSVTSAHTWIQFLSEDTFGEKIESFVKHVNIFGPSYLLGQVNYLKRTSVLDSVQQSVDVTTLWRTLLRGTLAGYSQGIVQGNLREVARAHLTGGANGYG